MSSLGQRLKDFVGYAPENNNNNATILDSKVTKKTVVTLGTMKAGKTTHLAGLGATAQYKASDSARTESKFRFIPKEAETNLLDDIAELRCGHFPPATPFTSGSSVKPAFMFEWEEPTFFGSKWFTAKRQVDMPVIDYAGEKLILLMKRVLAAKTLDAAMAVEASENAEQLTVTVNQASALLLIINAVRAEGLPIFQPDPHDKIKGLSKHPDVNTQRLLTPIIEYKHNNRRFSPPLEKIGVVITACDLLFPISKTIANFTGRPFDPLSEDINISNDSLDSFMKAFFPGTHSLIVSLGINIQYFPSYFETDGFWDEAKTEPKIKRGNIFDSPDWEHNVNRPKYTEFWFNREIEWIKGIATRV
jgi:hypothetical protein